MAEGKKNMDLFFDEKIKDSLNLGLSNAFTENVMKQVELEAKFAEEDKKTFNYAKYVLGAFSLLFVAFAAVLGYSLAGSNAESKSFSWLTDAAFFIESIPSRLLTLLGFSGYNISYLVMISGVVLLILLFSTADKFILKRKS